MSHLATLHLLICVCSLLLSMPHALYSRHFLSQSSLIVISHMLWSVHSVSPLNQHKVWFPIFGSPCLFTPNLTTMIYSCHPFHILHIGFTWNTLNDWHFIQIKVIPTSITIRSLTWSIQFQFVCLHHVVMLLF